jgi:hypothetical protein
MAKKRKDNLHEYRFKIDAYSPETMPLGRLAEYLADLAILFGEDKSIHLIEVEEGSTVLVNLIENEAEPKVRENLDAVVRKDAPPERMRAAKNIDERLRKDNAVGDITDPTGGKVIAFPGRDRIEPMAYGPFNQPGSLDGVPIAVGGELDLVPVHLEGRHGEIHNCVAKRSVAKEVAEHLFTNIIRVEGVARWVRRPTGQWEMVKFTIKDFKKLADASLRDAIQNLRAIPAEWKRKEDPLGELMEIRHGTDG